MVMRSDGFYKESRQVSWGVFVKDTMKARVRRSGYHAEQNRTMVQREEDGRVFELNWAGARGTGQESKKGNPAQ